MGALEILFIIIVINVIICTSTVPSQPITTFRGDENLQPASVLYVTILHVTATVFLVTVNVGKNVIATIISYVRSMIHVSQHQSAQTTPR